MINLALGLAQLGFWLLTYTTVERWIVDLIGFDFRHVVTLAIITLFWATAVILFKRMRVAVAVGPMYLLLALCNALSLLTLAIHAYIASQLVDAGAHPGVQDIMAPHFSTTADLYLRAAYPFVKVLLLISTIALVVPLVRSFGRGASNVPKDQS